MNIIDEQLNDTYKYQLLKDKYTPYYPKINDSIFFNQVINNYVRILTCKVRIKYNDKWYYYLCQKMYVCSEQTELEKANNLADFNYGVYVSLIGTKVDIGFKNEVTNERVFVLDDNQQDEFERLTIPSVKG